MSEHCSQCGDAIAADEWHPVATERNDDGTVEIRYFCGEDCRSAWQVDDGASNDGDDSSTHASTEDDHTSTGEANASTTDEADASTAEEADASTADEADTSTADNAPTDAGRRTNGDLRDD